MADMHYLVGLGFQVLLSNTFGPEVPEDTADWVWQHDLDFGVHVLEKATSACDGASSAASSNKVSHTALGLHPDLQHPICNSCLVIHATRHKDFVNTGG